MIALLIGTALAAGTYAYAKKKKQASTGQSAAAAAVTGAAGWGATVAALWAVSALWPVLLVGGAVGAAYYVGKKKSPKALPPASSE
jgi:hypothetical protein